MLDSKEIVEGYLYQQDWRVKENSNSPYSFGGLNKYISGEISKDYWLRHVYPQHVADLYVSGDIHIHDLSSLTVYCCGYSLKKVIELGVVGVPNIPESSPANHFASILNQLANITTIYQNEIAGAVAFSSVDTYLAPFIKEDKLTYKEVKQNLQNFVFSINSNSRGGAEPAFSNITLDEFPTGAMKHETVMVGGKLLDYTYGDCQVEMDMFNRAFCELMMEGDKNGRVMSYPIPTYNIYKGFDWDNPNNDLLWEMTGKFGVPYFANFINSDMDPDQAKSMCCRLRLDLRQLEKKNGGLFGAGEGTGSVGVVTLNLPRLAYQSKTKEELFDSIFQAMVASKESLEIKREFLTDVMLERGLTPAFNTYVGTLDNHFSTIGVIGLNEMCQNFFGDAAVDILSDTGKQLTLDVLDYMREVLSDFQEETGHLYNLEATPAESTAFRLAMRDRKQYPDIITMGTAEAPYYTNSCHIPVDKVTSIHQMFEHQNDIQIKFTGGTVVHIYLGASVTGEQAKHIVRTVCENYAVPYVSISPLTRYCGQCGYVDTTLDVCPTCGTTVDQYQRITGYTRNTKYFNEGKAQEFSERNQI